MPLIPIFGTSEDVAARADEAKALSVEMPSESLAEYALAASARVEELARRLQTAESQIPPPRSLGQLALDLREACIQAAEVTPQTTDRLAVARDRLAIVAEILNDA